MKPVLYLDVDDTLLSMHSSFYPRINPSAKSTWRFWGFAPPGAAEFMAWALETFEVRWLTWWCSSHEMYPEQLERLEREFKLPAGSLGGIQSAQFARGQGCHKTSGIDWKLGREWFWVEDAIPMLEQDILRARGCLERWIPCNTTDDLYALEKARAEITRRLEGQTAAATPDKAQLESQLRAHDAPKE